MVSVIGKSGVKMLSRGQPSRYPGTNPFGALYTTPVRRPTFRRSGGARWSGHSNGSESYVRKADKAMKAERFALR